MNLGYILRRIRLIKKYSLTDMSKLTGLSKASLSNIEMDKNNPTIDTLDKISNSLEIPTTKLLTLVKDLKSVETDMDEEQVDNLIKKHLLQQVEEDHFDILSTTTSINSAEEAVKFIINQPSVGDFGNFDVNKLSDEEKITFANDLLDMLRIISSKYSK